MDKQHLDMISSFRFKTILTFVFPLFLLSNFTLAQSTFPEHVILTWSGDPATSQSVTWRTKNPVAAPLAQIGLATDSPTTLPLQSITPTVQKLESDSNQTHYYYSATFQNLIPGQTYLYRVGDQTGGWTGWNDFSTPKNDASPYSFLYLGDIQNDILEWGTRAVRAAYAHRPEAAFMLFAGDCVNNGHDASQWQEWFRALGHIPSVMHIVPVTGNHEYDMLPGAEESSLSVFWNAQFELPKNGPKGLEESAYYIDYNSMRLIVLNSLIALNSEEDLRIQTEWLETVLKDNPQTWTVISYHHPLFSARDGRHGDYPELRNAWQPIFEKHQVDLVLQGHDHMYGRGNRQYKTIEVSKGQAGPVYLISVAGPKQYGILEEKRWMDRVGLNTQFYQEITIEGDLLQFRAYTVLGDLYDSFDLRKQEKGFNQFVEHISSESHPEKLFPGGLYSPKK
ncbi:metallophosphoesterase family protein [Algoriphagus jejuensis]|uniref:Metallophosphoesterase family protein n=1 Tax=Algoriphagus jejuensis TaxID=419934 RepID=A0ABN1N0T1_9BACT